MADRLAYFHVCPYNGTQFFADFCHELAARAVFQLKRCLDLRDVYSQSVFVQLCTSRFTGHGLYFGDGEQQLLGTVPHLVAFFQGNAWKRGDIDGERTFIERRQERAAQGEETAECHYK